MHDDGTIKCTSKCKTSRNDYAKLNIHFQPICLHFQSQILSDICIVVCMCQMNSLFRPLIHLTYDNVNAFRLGVLHLLHMLLLQSKYGLATANRYTDTLLWACRFYCCCILNRHKSHSRPRQVVLGEVEGFRGTAIILRNALAWPA